MKKIIYIATILLLVAISSCKIKNDATLASIQVIDENGNDVAGIPVYTYLEDTWDLFGDDPFFADKVVSTDAQGLAEIELDDIFAIQVFGTSETFYFSVHYTLNNVNKQKNVALTFKELEEKSASIILD